MKWAKLYRCAAAAAVLLAAWGRTSEAQGAGTSAGEMYVFGCDCLASDCLEELVTPEQRAKAVEWFRRHHVGKVYLESFRHGTSVPTARLREIRDDFRAAGLTVGGCFTPTNLNPAGRDETAKKMDYEQWCCYTDPEVRATLRAEVARAAALFDFVIIDDFLFTHCTCARCTAAKGAQSWADFRCALMQDVCREIDAAAKAANPKCTFIVKFPCWYAGYREAGYDVAVEPRILGDSWVGTETRDAGDPAQAFWIQAWMNEATGGLCGGGWFDALMTSDPAKYVEQARYTILGGAKETILHCYKHLAAPEPSEAPGHPYRRVIRWHACAEAFRQEVEGLEKLAAHVRGATLAGIPFARPAEATGRDRAVDVLRGGVPVKPVQGGGVAFPFKDEGTYAKATAVQLEAVQKWAAARTGVDFFAPGDVTLHLYRMGGEMFAAVVNLRNEPVTARLSSRGGAAEVLLALPSAASAQTAAGGELKLAPRALAFCRLPKAEPFRVDPEIPAGNAIIERVDEDRVVLRQDMRCSQDWFYWAFRVIGAEGRTVRFVFDPTYCGGPVSARGPAVTRDGGRTWSYAAEKSRSDRHFTYTFGPDEHETWFYQTFQYFPWQWDEFLAKHAAERGKTFETRELCRSRKGRSVPCARFGCIGREPRFRVVYTSRHHCEETTGTYALEGALERVFGQDELGAWLRENVEFLVVPIVDWDGATDGDQGKGRKPYDHECGYGPTSPYAETRALRRWVHERAHDRVDLMLDFHSPWMRGDYNEWVYLCHGSNPTNNAVISRWGRLLEQMQSGSLNYRTSCNIPWRFRWNGPWNSGSGFGGVGLGRWALDALQGVKLATTYEIPFAVANGRTVTPDACRELGRDTAAVLRAFLTDPAAGAETARGRPGAWTVDDRANLEKYAGLGRNFPKAIAFLRRDDLEKLAPGRHEIDGTNCWAMVSDVMLRPAEGTRGELHGAYWDVHVPLTGPEVIGFSEMAPGAAVGGGDVAFFDRELAWEGVGPRQFALCAPGKGLHAPGCQDGDAGGRRTVRKIVVKILAD